MNIYSFQYVIDNLCGIISKNLFWFLALMTAINLSVAFCQLATCKFLSFGKSLLLFGTRLVRFS